MNKVSQSVLYQKILNFQKKRRETIDIKDSVDDVVRSSECKQRLCHLFIQHMSGLLIVCGNADLTVRKDLERFMVCFILDGDAIFKHIEEGPDDMPVVFVQCSNSNKPYLSHSRQIRLL